MVSHDSACRNRILALLPHDDLAGLLPYLESVQVKANELLQPRGKLAQYAYFPITGVASMISLDARGASVEVATVGYDGLTGLSLYLGGESASLQIMMQVPGEALRVSARHFQRFVTHPSFMRVLLLYTQALIAQIAQTSACNRMHPIEQRCARWLLQSHDRARTDRFQLTHEFLGIMLGVRRASVTEVAGRLQAKGAIRYVRGVITVLDRSGLENASCSCYAVLAKLYDKVLGAKPLRAT